MECHNMNGVLCHYLRRMADLYQGENSPGINDFRAILKDLVSPSFKFIPGNEPKEKIEVEVLCLPSGLRIQMPCIRVWDGRAKIYGYIAAFGPGKTRKSIDFYLFTDCYKQVFPNLILTDYFEFRYYREAQKVCTAKPFNALALSEITNKTRATNTMLFLKELRHLMGYCPKKSRYFTLIGLQQGLALKTVFLREFVLIPLMNYLDTSGSKCELVRLYRAYCYYFDMDLTVNEFSALLTHVIIDGLLRAVIFYRSIDIECLRGQNENCCNLCRL